MEDKIKELLNPSLKSLEIFVDSVKLEQENNNLFLRVCLDGKKILDLDKIVEATKIINPIMDENDMIDKKYILEVYGKSKGDAEIEKS